jgi:cytochrome oxidase Cu insertion factor (SCO1/SenC/PrrC family)
MERSGMKAGGCVLALAGLLIAGGQASAHETAPVKADFKAPAPGTYRLERIMASPDGRVVDSNRKRGQLSAYTRDKVTLLSLMYTACSDEKGCPLAFYTLDMIKRDLERSPGTRGRVRLVSLSFDPEHDTPEVMRAYGGGHAKGGGAVPWHFLTTASKRDVAPLLDGFGQDVSRPAKDEDRRPGDLTHVLKVFLIDRSGWVREVYSTSYLVPQVVVNDVKTLLIEDGVASN